MCPWQYERNGPRSAVQQHLLQMFMDTPSLTPIYASFRPAPVVRARACCEASRVSVPGPVEMISAFDWLSHQCSVRGLLEGQCLARSRTLLASPRPLPFCVFRAESPQLVQGLPQAQDCTLGLTRCWLASSFPISASCLSSAQRSLRRLLSSFFAARRACAIAVLRSATHVSDENYSHWRNALVVGELGHIQHDHKQASSQAWDFWMASLAARAAGNSSHEGALPASPLQPDLRSIAIQKLQSGTRRLSSVH